ncbi:MAG: hypothetical protein ACFCVA_02615 [Gammaproteobacteria bacterium]
MDDARIKRAIIKALVFPRALIRGEISIEECPHAGNFCPQDRECQECHCGAECEWLFSSDESVALEEKSLDELEGALEFAVGYVDARIMRLGHEASTCHCRACSWLTSGMALVDQVAALSWGINDGPASTLAISENLSLAPKAGIRYQAQQPNRSTVR